MNVTHTQLKVLFYLLVWRKITIPLTTLSSNTKLQDIFNIWVGIALIYAISATFPRLEITFDGAEIGLWYNPKCECLRLRALINSIHIIKLCLFFSIELSRFKIRKSKSLFGRPKLIKKLTAQ